MQKSIEESRQKRAADKEKDEAIFRASRARREAQAVEKAKKRAEEARLAEGYFPKEQLIEITRNFETALESEDAKKALFQIDYLCYQYTNASTDRQREQLKILIEQHLDQDRLVKKWAEQMPGISTLSLATTVDTQEGRNVREAVNRAIMYYALSEKKQDERGKDMAKLMLESALKADEGYTKRSMQGNRYVSRVERLHEFETNDPAVKEYAAKQVSPFIVQELGLHDLNAESFLGHEIMVATWSCPYKIGQPSLLKEVA